MSENKVKEQKKKIKFDIMTVLFSVRNQENHDDLVLLANVLF